MFSVYGLEFPATEGRFGFVWQNTHYTQNAELITKKTCRGVVSDEAGLALFRRTQNPELSTIRLALFFHFCYWAHSLDFAQDGEFVEPREHKEN